MWCALGTVDGAVRLGAKASGSAGEIGDFSIPRYITGTRQAENQIPQISAQDRRQEYPNAVDPWSETSFISTGFHKGMLCHTALTAWSVILAMNDRGLR